MALIFGLDIGVTSIGWAVVCQSTVSAETANINLGTRIFSEARDTDGTPLNQQRRLARMMRRQTRRRRERRRSLNEFLSQHGLLPPFTSSEWSAAMGRNPYLLRSQALERPLTPHELGRALYHLSKRRHFLARDLDDEGEAIESSEDKDEKEAQSARERTRREIAASGLTLGGYLEKLPADRRKRGLHALRSDVESEFQKILKAQAAYHPILNGREFNEELRQIIFFQRPVFWRKSTLGSCRFVPDAPLAPKGSWISMQRRMLEKLNNLEIATGNGRPLDQAERAAILSVLQEKDKLTWPQVRTALEPVFKARGESAKYLRFNLEAGGEKHLLGHPLERKLAQIFGADWAQHPFKSDIREAADLRLRASDYGDIGQRVVILREAERKLRRREAARSFITDFGATQSQVAELEKLSFPTGWDTFSYAAIDAFMPELEKGTRLGALLISPDYEHWRNKTFPGREQSTGEIHDKLRSPASPEEAARQREIRNPTVVRIRNQMRKVVNNLIAVHGKPDLIRIEVTREVGLSKAEREERSAGMRRQETRRKAAKADLVANGFQEPSGRDVEKWLLWKEAGERDPYSGDHVSFDALFRNGEYEVEHIWPRSRSLDDSFANKTLCRKDFNLRKGNRTPYEAFGADEDLWNRMVAAIGEMTAAKGKLGVSRGKARRFMAKELPDDFASRQLNDTGYAARQSVAFLRSLWPDVPNAPVTVQAVSGRVTAHLRRLWGLNHILGEDGEKNRADHRHHAIDALVVACTDPGVTNRLSRYWQAKDQPQGPEAPRLDPPWPSIRQDAAAAVSDIVVSHRVRKKISGALHKQTIYGDTRSIEKKGKVEYRLFTVRKPLEALSRSEIEDIRDERLRSIVTEWVAERGGDPKKAFPPYPTVSPGGPEIRKVRLLVKQQMGLMAPVANGYADLGSNHHVAIYRTPEGKAEFEVVSLLEAARRLQRRQRVVKDDRQGPEFVMSLSQGDCLSIDIGERKGLWTVISIWSGGQIVLQRLEDAIGATTFRPTCGTLLGIAATKLSIDPIGRIRPAND